MDGDASDSVCEGVCAEVLETLIANNFDTGWNEVSAEEAQRVKENK